MGFFPRLLPFIVFLFIDKISINIPVQVYFERGRAKESGAQKDDETWNCTTNDEVPVAFVKSFFPSSRYGILEMNNDDGKV